MRAELHPQQAFPGWGWMQGQGEGSQHSWPGLDSTARHDKTRKGAAGSCHLSTCTHGLQPKSKESRRLFITHRASPSHWGQIKTSEGRQNVCRFGKRRRHRTELALAECLEAGVLEFNEVMWLPQGHSGLTLKPISFPYQGPDLLEGLGNSATSNGSQKEPTCVDSGSEMSPMLPPPISRTCASAQTHTSR